MLVALGITADGHKEILDVLHAPSESAEAWTTLLTRLKMRGLEPEQLSLVLTDGDAGLGRGQTAGHRVHRRIRTDLPAPGPHRER